MKKYNSMGVVWWPVPVGAAAALFFTIFAIMLVHRWMPGESLVDEGTGSGISNSQVLQPKPKPVPRKYKRAPIGAAAGIAKDGDGKWHAIITDDKGYVICSPSSQLDIQPGQPPGCNDCGFYVPSRAHFHPTHTQSENEEIRERNK